MSLFVETIQGSVSPKGEVVATIDTVAAIIVLVEVFANADHVIKVEVS